MSDGNYAYGYFGPDGVRYYGCCLCQKEHREGLDPEYPLHIGRQSKHGIQYRAPTIGERFAREMEAGDPKPVR